MLAKDSDKKTEWRIKMIQIICKSESYTYNAYHILKAFYPSQEVSCKTDEEASNYVTVQLPDGQEIFAETENLQTEKKRQTDLNLHGECLQAYVRPSLLCRSWKPAGKKKIISDGHGKAQE